MVRVDVPAKRYVHSLPLNTASRFIESMTICRARSRVTPRLVGDVIELVAGQVHIGRPGYRGQRREMAGQTLASIQHSRRQWSQHLQRLAVSFGQVARLRLAWRSLQCGHRAVLQYRRRLEEALFFRELGIVFGRPRSERTVCEADDRDQKSRDCERGSNRIARDLGQRARLRLKLLHDIVNATALAYREHAQETQVFAQSAQLAE